MALSSADIPVNHKSIINKIFNKLDHIPDKIESTLISVGAALVAAAALEGFSQRRVGLVAILYQCAVV